MTSVFLTLSLCNIAFGVAVFQLTRRNQLLHDAFGRHNQTLRYLVQLERDNLSQRKPPMPNASYVPGLLNETRQIVSALEEIDHSLRCIAEAANFERQRRDTSRRFHQEKKRHRKRHGDLLLRNSSSTELDDFCSRTLTCSTGPLENCPHKVREVFLCRLIQLHSNLIPGIIYHGLSVSHLFR